MGNGRGIRRQVRGKKPKRNHIEMLAFLLGNFYDYLGQENRPTDEEVRERFKSDEAEWVQFCDTNNLTEDTKKLFNVNVSAMWERRKQKN